MPNHGKTAIQSLWATESVHQPIEQNPTLAHPLNLRIENLPASHVLMLPGHHNWKLWRSAMEALLDRAGPPQP